MSREIFIIYSRKDLEKVKAIPFMQTLVSRWDRMIKDIFLP